MMQLNDWLTFIISAGTLLVSSIKSIKQAEDHEKDRILFLLLISVIAGLLLIGILTQHMPLGDGDSLLHVNPLWYGSYMLLSLAAGFIAGKWLGIRSLGLFLGFVLWLFGLFPMMSWYKPYSEHGTLLPWIYILILLLPICGLLSWLGAWLATRKNPRDAQQAAQP